MKKSEFLNFLADLTINGENEAIALGALKLQCAIQKAEFEKNPVVWVLVLNGENQAYFSSFDRVTEGFKNFVNSNGKSFLKKLNIRQFKYVGDLTFEELFEKYSINLLY